MAVVEPEDGDVPGALFLDPYLCGYLYFSKKRNSVKEGRRNMYQAPIGLPRVATPRSSVISPCFFTL